MHQSCGKVLCNCAPENFQFSLKMHPYMLCCTYWRDKWSFQFSLKMHRKERDKDIIVEVVFQFSLKMHQYKACEADISAIKTFNSLLRCINEYSPSFSAIAWYNFQFSLKMHPDWRSFPKANYSSNFQFSLKMHQVLDSTILQMSLKSFNSLLRCIILLKLKKD